MKAARMLKALSWIGCAAPGLALGQVPDLLTAFDAGGRALGAGSSFYATGIDTLSATYNPAGLGFAKSKSINISSRNFPTNQTTVSNSLSDPTLSTRGFSGEQGLGHVGVTFPIESRTGADKGAFSIAMTTVGWFNDTQFGQNLAGGVQSYVDFTRARTSMVTLSWGKTLGDRGLSYGVGAVYAIQNVRNFQRITFTDNNIPPQISDTDDTGNGIGAIFGVLFTPESQSNLTFGASVRTPIKVRSNASGLSLYDNIPGRVVLGTSMANDGLRGGRDSMVFGAQLQWFFSGKESERLDRKDSFAAFGAGIEYGYTGYGGVIPIRFGYNWNPAGGNDFKQRSGMTYGIGYRPNKGDWTIDVNFARPSGGGQDTSVMFGYRFGG